MKWDPAAADRAIRFFPSILRLAEGEFAGRPFELDGWQQFVVGSLFGWKGPDGFRRFRMAYIETAKGSGKSPLGAGVGLYMLTADHEARAECYAAATTKEQANILFQDAVAMRDASPELVKRVMKSGKNKAFNLAHLASGSFFRPMSSDVRSKDGPRVHFAVVDELMEQPNGLIVDKMRAGTKARRQALILELTNSGYDRQSVCWQHHEYSEKILTKVLHNDAWFAFVCNLDDGDKWTDERVWPKVNPSLGVTITLKYLREQVQEALGMPSKENIVKRLNFCIWTEQGRRWLPLALWDACRGKHSAQELRALVAGERCFGGIDLSLTTDLSAFVLVFPPTDRHEEWIALAWFWCPEDDIATRSKRDHVDYDVWEREGFLFKTPGNIVDHDFIEEQIRQLRSEFDIAEVGYDPALATQLVTHLKAEGLLLTTVAQKPMIMSPAVQTIEKLLLGKQLQHGGHKLLRWCFSNVAVRMDSNGNVKFDKEKSYERIDGMSAFATAMVRAIPGASSMYSEVMFI